MLTKDIVSFEQPGPELSPGEANFFFKELTPSEKGGKQVGFLQKRNPIRGLAIFLNCLKHLNC